MSELVLMKCPECQKTLWAKRDPTDYHDTHTIVLVCDECDDGDFAEAFHFDAQGNHITRDPMKDPK